MNIQANDIINFWFSEKIKSAWFNSTKEMDQGIHAQFYDTWQQAKIGELDDWLNSAQGCLALAIILDQFPLNMFRAQVKSFSTEAQAILVSKHAISHELDLLIDKQQRAFLYMPLMHSEDINDQNTAVEMFEKSGLIENMRFAQHHRSIIKRFSRFPHRNEILGRLNSEAEIVYLASDEAFKG